RVGPERQPQRRPDAGRDRRHGGQPLSALRRDRADPDVLRAVVADALPAAKPDATLAAVALARCAAGAGVASAPTRVEEPPPPAPRAASAASRRSWSRAR